ncbi:YggS family pyridoxal phosphate-dependent enzyme [Brevundimonas faecalis]|uniref:Pyridoxal phosphate homeostasis protein n=1 Tax=Brevundimonas faecalis TaxID=947378 RepID=A0ABV2RC71_9CAUL
MTASTPASPFPSIADRFAAVRGHVVQAAVEAGRDPASIVLTAVSKTQGEAALQAALDAGQRVFGENRVQEAYAHWVDRRAAFPDLELRLIGPLQTNKATEAVALFDVIETLDREKLAAALAAAMKKTGRRPQVLIQVNTGAEPQKAGVLPDQADGLIASARDAYGLTVEGLMCIPPADAPPEPHFALLAEIAARNGLRVLSMGMSGDYQAAIRLGATHVRVGSALFGERRTP